ncbi:hypothetical protein BofuT4_P003550.1 [Botrytis cinerea T4]|uniref:Uncharacterized protein n=1 Tax=Botryotinia fuckeliana (strain T4) TaxID=999810 RepID=G2Y3F6_BOTF4|nr:hypothetical protein BofuT4_P003550.1 [Botrytis cinerea T4]
MYHGNRKMCLGLPHSKGRFFSLGFDEDWKVAGAPTLSSASSTTSCFNVGYRSEVIPGDDGDSGDSGDDERYGSDLLATAIPRGRSKFACLEKAQKGDAMFGYGAGQTSQDWRVRFRGS